MDDKDKIKLLEEKLARIERISQLPRTASLESVIDAINKITNSLKR